MASEVYQALKFVPEEISSKRLECPACRASFRPDWLKPRGIPMGSVEAPGGYWVRESAYERCPSCGSNVEVKIPVREKKATVLLFGDEAIRVLNDVGGRIYTYSLIGTSKPFLEGIESDLRHLKKALSPAIDPDEWKIHMTAIWSGQQRKKKPEYKHWDEQTIKRLIGGIGEIIGGAAEKLFRYNIVLAGQPTSPSEIKRFENYVQHEAYILLVMKVIDEITGLGGQPVFHFDSIKPAKADTIIHKWAKDAFAHGSANLLFSFLSHSVVIPEPVFVPPASRPLLEIADFASFLVARYHFRAFQRKAPEIDLKVLGEVMFMTFSMDGNRLLQKRAVGFPWELNFRH